MLSINQYIVERHILEKLCLDCIPDDAGIDKPEAYEGTPRYSKYLYFGNCVNTVNSDHMWDATQMSNWLNTCKMLDIDLVIDKIANGDRPIPQELTKNLKDKDDLSKVCCGIDDHQKIMFIYVTKTDKHYFFDCK